MENRKDSSVDNKDSSTDLISLIYPAGNVKIEDACTCTEFQGFVPRQRTLIDVETI